jgi:HSP20 family protein
MPVIKIRVGDNLEGLQKNLRHFVDNFFQVSIPRVASGGGWIPAVDVCEAKDAVYVVADVPGVDSKSLRLSLEGQFLRLAGHRYPPFTEAQRLFYQMEIEYGPFERVIRLPANIDPEHVDAQYENGLLVVRLVRKELEESTKIEIS